MTTPSRGATPGAQGPPVEAEPVTDLLSAWSAGDHAAGQEALPLVYQELRAVARRALRSERPGHTLDPTALVHEAWLRLERQAGLGWHSRAQFFATAAHLMRQVLVDHARRRRAGKRGGSAVHLTLSAARGVAAPDVPDILALDAALNRLAQRDARKCAVVELRCFAGLGERETAQALGISEVTVRRDLRFAEAWLRRDLARQAPTPGPGAR